MKLKVAPTEAFLAGHEEFQSYFREERHRVKVSPFAGPDFSSLTAIFPGQGVFFEGQFGEWLNGKSRVRDFFQQADAYAQTWSLPKPSLYLTAPQRINPAVRIKLKNLALFALEVGLYEELSQVGLSFRRVCGYSFGEYAAWTTAGVLSFAQMLEVIYWREELAPAPHSNGAMILVGASEERIAAVLTDCSYFIANRNLPEQLILACEPLVADHIVKALFKSRIPCQKIGELAYPYHSPLMQDTANRLAEKLSELKLEIVPPRLPLFSSVLHRWIEPANFDPKEFLGVLSRQLTEPVDFIKIESALAAQGHQSIIELGPASMTELFKKLHPSSYTFLPLADYYRGQAPDSKKYDEKIHQSKFVSIVSKVVANLTGYEIEDIAVEDRFQEDLGIDSLKKAEVMFLVLHEAKIDVDSELNTSRFKALGDLVEYLERGPQESETRQKSEKMDLPFARYHNAWVKQPLNLHLPVHAAHRELRLEVYELVHHSARLRAQILEEMGASDARPLLLRLECPTEDCGFEAGKWQTVVRFWRDLSMELPEKELRLALVGEQKGPIFSGLRAFFKSVAKEQSNLIFLPVGCAGPRPETGWIWEQMQRPRLIERHFSPESCQERAWVKASAPSPKEAAFSPTKIVCFGGAGGIAFELLSRYPLRSSSDVHLIGRRPSTDISVQDRISMLEFEFASVTYHQVDASDRERLHVVLDTIDRNCGGIDLIINATGVDRSSPLKTKSNDEIDDEIRQKLLPANYLEDWCRGHTNVYRAHFSSIAGLFGNSSQSVYALANSTLSAQVLQGAKDKVLVVHWPAWQNVGMTARSAVRLTLMEGGVALLKPEEGARFFWEDISQSHFGEVTYLTEDYLIGEAARNVRFDLVREFLGSITGSGRRVIEKDFRLNDDTYLQDHCVQNKCCVPAAAVLVMYLELIYLMSGEFKPIRNFEMLNMLIVDQEGVRANVGLRPINGDLHLYLRSLMVHAHAVIGSGDEPRLISKQPLEAKAGKEPFPIKQFYAPGKLFHGPRLKVIHEAWRIDANTSRARIHRELLADLYGCEFFDVLMPVLDGAFQLLVVSGYLKTRMMALPVGVKCLRYNADADWTKHLWLQVETADFVDGIGRGSAFVYNDNGEIIIEMTDVTVREGASAEIVKH
jgi:malonyl CoA-acyl carrier protein transacylase/acyl carrier protein